MLGCTPAAAPQRLADELAAHVSVDAMVTHLQALQGIADANHGNRADGTSGFEASVDYVAKALRDKGFDVSTPEFERLDSVSPGRPTLTIGGRGYPVDQASLLLQTPVGGVSGPVLRPAAPAGCVAGDYKTGAARGGIAVVDDTACSVVVKQNAAATAGAAALVVVSSATRNGSPPGLFETGYYDRLTIPVAVANADYRCRSAPRHRSGAPAPGRQDRQGEVAKRIGADQNRIAAERRDGRRAPGQSERRAGMNDNGSGVAAVLETALQLGSSPAVPNAVRFAFWGGSEDQLAGSIRYVAGLSRDELNDLALYLNFDELASPNAGYFTLDGDQSGPASPDIDPNEVPVGSAGLERTLAGYLNLAGRRPADMPLGVASDDSAFLHAGVPIGGLTTGAAQIKTKTQARLWGGDAGVAFDPNYRTARDDLGAVNRDALAVMGAGVAFAVGTYAASLDGVNGVPPPVQRHRAHMGP